MYAIKIYDKVNEWSRDVSFIGYYTGLYNGARADSGKFIGANTIREPEYGYNIQLFKTKQAAENKITKLKEVKEYNLHLSHMKFEIVELAEKDANTILKAKESRKSTTKREIIYTGVSKNYLEELLQMLKDQIDLDAPLTEQYKLKGKIEIIKQILDSLN